MTKIIKVTRKPKNKYRHGNLKDELVQAALQMIQEKGNVEFTLRELAKKTGVSHAAAYKHFQSKNDILLHVAVDGFKKLSDTFKKVLAQDECDVVALGTAYINFAIENRSYFRVMFHPDFKLPPNMPKSANPGVETYLILKQCIDENLKSKKFSGKMGSEIMSLSCWALVHGISVLWMNGNLFPLPDGSEVSNEKITACVPKIIVEGLLNRTMAKKI